MGFNKKSITSILLIILTVVSGFALYTYGNGGLNQILIILHFGILVTLALLNNILSDKFVLIVLFINLASIVITMMYHSSFGVSIVFLNMLLACFVFNNIQVEKNIYLFLHLIPAILWTVIVIFSVKGDYPISTGEIFDYSFFGIIYQKNTVGIVALGCIYSWLSVLETFNIRRITKNIISVPIIVVFLLKILESNCRSATFATILFCVLYYFIRNEIPYKWYYIILLIGIVLSGLFTIYYVENVVEIDLGDVMGRNTFHRLGTWEAAFNLIRRYPIFGSGTDIKMLIYDSAHNTVLSILKTIGIIPTLTYAVCFAKRLQNKKQLRYERVCQMAIISALMVSVFESFYVESYFYLTFLMLLINPLNGNDRSLKTSSDYDNR
jgi:hypothetical protein